MNVRRQFAVSKHSELSNTTESLETNSKNMAQKERPPQVPTRGKSLAGPIPEILGDAEPEQLRELSKTNVPKTDPSRTTAPEPDCTVEAIVESLTIEQKFDESQKQCSILRDQVLELRKNLDDAQNFIFSLQPRSQILTETEAAEDFSSLCDSIEELVERKLGDALDDEILIKKGKQRQILLEPCNILFSLIPTPGKESFNCPGTDEYNISAAIVRLLYIEIFDREFYCAFGSAEMSFMQSVERSMRNLEPQRDHITYATWRSETYTAITNRHEFEEMREGMKGDLTARLTEILALFLSRPDKKNLYAEICQSIVNPAFTLAHKMHLSVDHFSLEWSRNHHLPFSQQLPFEDSNDFEVVELQAGGTGVKTHKTPPTSESIRYLFDMTPRLVLQRTKANSPGERKVLKKARLLCLDTKDGVNSPRDLHSRSTSDPTVLSWLDKILSSHRRGALRR
ncbi:hypothetical protein BJ875DRAFT_441871 [Amylocarpus encephaloides]|uniref:Uncharacterized protein n=1 Tax=Amylocarpus encephaloides TaxID=45428 RepID=A0A9P8C532_9HELO|nr:hypothetical protein BJ875DRAFT_441871 [Amylocarpus encephaloides]